MIPTVLSLVLAACSPAEDARPRPTTIPINAIEIENDVYYLGTEIDPATGEEVEGFAFVDRVEDPNHAIDVDAVEPTARLGCYGLGRFGGWTAAESWGLDGTNSSGLLKADIKAALKDAQEVWEAAASTDIFGSFDASYSGVADGTFDGENNVQFGDAGGASTLAVTFYWGRTTGVIEILEWDQIYDDGFDWSIGDPAASDAYDFFSLAAHEFGHAAGLTHPATTTACKNETMYKHTSKGQTKKRTLNTGDTQGLLSIY